MNGMEVSVPTASNSKVNCATDDHVKLLPTPTHPTPTHPTSTNPTLTNPVTPAHPISSSTALYASDHEQEVRAKLTSITETRDYLTARTTHRPSIAVICGTGMGELADLLTEAVVFDYGQIPNFLAGSVPGHAGKLIFGNLRGKCIVCMKGRVHAYEGHPMWKMTFPIRVFAELGVKILIVTNAGGGLNPDYAVGDVMIMKDHINFGGLAGQNPFVGLNDDRFGPRFCPLSDAYDRSLRQLAKSVACDLDMTSFIREGVYLCQVGPCFETVAECRMIHGMGADAVGMSTVYEVAVARHVGIRCLGITLITNKCLMDWDSDREAASHAETLDSGRRRAEDLKRFVSGVVDLMGDSDCTAITNGIHP